MYAVHVRRKFQTVSSFWVQEGHSGYLLSWCCRDTFTAAHDWFIAVLVCWIVDMVVLPLICKSQKIKLWGWFVVVCSILGSPQTVKLLLSSAAWCVVSWVPIYWWGAVSWVVVGGWVLGCYVPLLFVFPVCLLSHYLWSLCGLGPSALPVGHGGVAWLLCVFVRGIGPLDIVLASFGSCWGPLWLPGCRWQLWHLLDNWDLVVRLWQGLAQQALPHRQCVVCQSWDSIAEYTIAFCWWIVLLLHLFHSLISCAWRM